MIGSKVRGLVAGTALMASMLVAGGSTQSAVAAALPWTGTITVHESLNAGKANFPETCSVTSGNDSTNTNLTVDWDGSFSLTNINFVPVADGHTDVSDNATVGASLQYSEVATHDNPNCKHETENYTGTFSGGNTLSNEPPIIAGADATHLYLTLSSGMVAGTSQQTGDDPETDNSATWREYPSTAITVPITGNKAVGTFSPAVIRDDGLPASEFYGYSPFGLGLTTDNTVHVNLSRGPSATPKAPTTTITKGPASKTTARTATFKFTSNTKSVTFHCSLDGKKATTCKSPKTYKQLKVGKHAFAVYAVNPKTKLRDKTPAKKAWTIKKKPKTH